MERSRTDYYRVLQVDPSANPLVIQAAYRVLARIFHPDVEGDDEQMKRLNRAWEVLGDPRRRAAYDIERAGRHLGPIESSPRRSTHSDTATPTPAAPPTTRASTTSASETSGEPQATRLDDHAGPPIGTPFGPVLRFGRYAGWTLGQVVRVDRPFLEWLKRAPAGRGLKDEIDAVLLTRRGPGAVDERRTYETQQGRVHAWAPGAPTKVR